MSVKLIGFIVCVKNKNFMMKNRNTSKVLISVFTGILSLSAFGQGFLEMPDTSEVPEYERESMLLDLDVPPVRERDPDPEAGPRLNVKEFRLQGLVEYPELGITRSGLIERVESIRFDLMKEGDLTDSGYTLDELGEISDLMAEIEKESEGEHVGSLEVQKLVFLIREQRRQRGVTLGMIETVADTITRFYREKGFILAKAYIPQQKVRDGVVTLTLLLGELGEVEIENNKRVSERAIKGVFKKDMHKPVTSWKVEEALYLVNDIPGVSAQGFFSPGSQVGDTKLSVNVLNEDLISSNVRLDNHGSPTTGENRLYTDFIVHNPLGIGDEIQLSVLGSFNPENTLYGSFRYNTHIMNPRWRYSMGVSTNDFVSTGLGFGGDSGNDTSDPDQDIDPPEVSFQGKSLVSDVSLSYIFKRSRVKNYSTSFTVTDISTDLETLVDDRVLDEQINDVLNASLAFNFDILEEAGRRLHVGNVAITRTDNAPLILTNEDINSDNTNSTIETQESAWFLNYDYSMLSFVNIPFTKKETRLLFKSSGQYAGKAMTNVNQFALTGPTKVRAYEVNAALFDDALYFGADWIFTLPSFGGAKMFGVEVNKVFQPYLSADVAYGVLHPNGPTSLKVTGEFASIGAGLKFNYKSLSGSLSFASPTHDKIENDDGVEQPETETTSVFFDLQYSF